LQPYRHEHTIKKASCNRGNSRTQAIPHGGKENILVGSPGLIVAMANLDLIDECQPGIQPTVLSNGLPLFTDIINRINLTFLNTKTFDCGVVFHYHEPAGK